MKTLKSNIYKNIASLLASDNSKFKTAQDIVLFNRVITTYPSKNIYCLTASRLISFIEKNILSVQLIIEIMKEEGEEEEIITNVEFLNKNPSITTDAEVTSLHSVLYDYVKYASILKVKNSFIQALDLIDEDEDSSNMKNHIDSLYKMSSQIVSAYNTYSVSSGSHTFDTDNPDCMKNVIAETIDSRAPDKVIQTSIKGLNTLLSPGYLSGYLYVYAALPGNYKSGILLSGHIDTCKYNAHVKNTTNGKTPISMYISMENTMTQTIRRLWALLFPTSDLNMYSVDDATKMIQDALSSEGLRSVILYYGYREKSTDDLATIMRSYNDENNEVVALYLDYIKRIRPSRTDSAAMASEKTELNAIMNELKLLASQFNIPIITGHQLNREAAKAVDNVVSNGGFNKTNEVLGRSQISSAWEVMEVADFLAIMNIENNGEMKMLMIKAAKQRDVESNAEESVTAIRHPFMSSTSFALQPDIMENVSMSVPIFVGKQTTNFMANI